jgi:hypothetical protein
MKFPSYTFFTDTVDYGDSFGPFIRINPKYKYHPDLAIHEHEHVKQWYQMTFVAVLCYIIICSVGSIFLPTILTNFPLHSSVLLLCCTLDRFFYKHITSYRQYKEVKSYAKQIKFLCEENKFKLSERPIYIDHFSNVLSVGYNLNISYKTAHSLITKELS